MRPKYRPEIDTTWQPEAACRKAPPALFYPDVDPSLPGGGWDGPVARNIVRHVKAAYCGTCPVRRACLQHALSFPELHGIWAGTTPPEREALQAKEQRTA